jgi:hypothetical protein
MPTAKGPYSPDDVDFVPAGRNLEFMPGRKPGKPVNVDGFKAGIDLSATIDPQAASGHGFDSSGKTGDWRSLSSDSARGGFSGVASRSNNHPKYRK